VQTENDNASDYQINAFLRSLPLLIK